MQDADNERTVPYAFDLSRTSRLGDVSFKVLLDRFQPVEYRYVPKRTLKHFRWFVTVPSSESPKVPPWHDVLFLCHLDIAEQLLKENPSCVCLARSKGDEDLSWIERGHYQSRIVVFVGEKRFYYYDAVLHNIFISDLIWENEMDRVVYSHGRLEKLIEVSESMLGNFFCITDSGYNLDACSTAFAPQSDELRHLVANNSLSKEEIAHLEKNVIPLSTRKQQVILAPADDAHSYPVLHMPVFIDGGYLLHVSMECVNGSADALRDLFVKFARRVVTLVTEFWHSTVDLETPWHRVLVGILEGEAATSDYLETQLSMTAIPNANQFRVLYARFDPLMTNQARMKFLESSRKLNGGQSYPFLYRDDAVVLLYALSKNDAALSALEVDPSVRELVYEPFGMTMSCSQAFQRIEDLGNAYKQATIAYDLRGVIAREMELVNGKADMPVCPFDHCLKFYLLMGEVDRDLVQYSFKTSILKRLVDEDARQGTEIAHLLWVYLSCDKNATETAKRVHVHRNTVLYHIDRIEKRFGLNFDSPFLRNRIVLDYQQLMLEGIL